MKLGKSFRKFAYGLGILAFLALPMVARADGFNMNVNIGGDDQAHFDFKGMARRHHPVIWKAAQQLRKAKHTLWVAADDFHGHKIEAIQAINAALDQLRVCESR